MRILINKIQRKFKDEIVQTYAESFVREVRDLGHPTQEIGQGHELSLNSPGLDLSAYDLLIDLDCGRKDDGDFQFVYSSDRHDDRKLPIKTAVWLIDTHGHPDLHRRIAKKYDHVFFAVWRQRDLFAQHPSAHFLPNATDTMWFDIKYRNMSPEHDFGFFGSKHGLSRADELKEICSKRGWSCDIRQVNNQARHRWPFTAMAIGNCKIGFNQGQKHDINLRIFETMATGIPLVNDFDESSGIGILFKPWKHFIPYWSPYKSIDNQYSLEAALGLAYAMDLKSMAENARNEVLNKHLVKHRVAKILEVCS